jgi:hypothetical protein
MKVKLSYSRFHINQPQIVGWALPTKLYCYEFCEVVGDAHPTGNRCRSRAWQSVNPVMRSVISLYRLRFVKFTFPQITMIVENRMIRNFCCDLLATFGIMSVMLFIMVL